MYENASVTPLSTWMMNANSVALPKTYHQRAPRGTGWLSIGPSSDEMPRRSSSVSQAIFEESLDHRQPIGIGLGADLDLVVVDADRVARERVGRRAGGDAAVLVVDAAVAGAHEEARLWHPAHRAAEVGAVHGEGDELGPR